MSAFRPSTVLGCALVAAPVAWFDIRRWGPPKVVRHYKDEQVTNIHDGILLSRVTVAGSGRDRGRDVTYTYTWTTPRRIHVEPGSGSRAIKDEFAATFDKNTYAQYSLFKLTKRVRVLTWRDQ